MFRFTRRIAIVLCLIIFAAGCAGKVTPNDSADTTKTTIATSTTTSAAPRPRALLGINVTDSKPDEEGALVGYLFPDSLAARSGFKEGDLVVKIGETEISALSDIQEAMSKVTAGDVVRVEVVRSGQQVVVNAATEPRP